MTALIRWSPGDRAIEFALVLMMVVWLTSSLARCIARRLPNQAALRHLVLISALVCCLASPVLIWFWKAAGVSVVSIPLLCPEQEPGSTSAAPSPRDRHFKTQPEHDSREYEVKRHGESTQTVRCLLCPDLDEKPISNSSDASPCPEAMPSTPDGSRTRDAVAVFHGLVAGVVFVWVAGAVVMAARLARDCGRVLRLRGSAHTLASYQPLNLELAARLGMHQPPLLLASHRQIAPMAVGFGRPAVILSERLVAEVNEDEMQDILLHELAHLHRGDQRTVLLQQLIGALFWPIASVHGLNRQLHQAREELCDNVVLANRSAIDYGKTLLHVAELLVMARPLHAAAGIIHGQGDLERRIAEMLTPKRSTLTTTRRKTAFLVAFVFVVGSTVASATRLTASVSAAGAETEPNAKASPVPSAAPPDETAAGAWAACCAQSSSVKATEAPRRAASPVDSR